MTFLARAFVDADGSVASVRLLVQKQGCPLVAWRGELPYGLWACWGTEQTAVWRWNQFLRHDAVTATAAGYSRLGQALVRGLHRQQAVAHNPWLPTH